MGNFFQKMVAGAASAGAPLYADMAREKLRADIGAKRDAVLHQNRLDIENQRQQATTALHDEKMAQQQSQFDAEMAHKKESATASAAAADIANTSAKNLAQLKADYTNAKTDEERSTIANLMAAEQGKPVENLPSTATGSGNTAAMKEAKVLATLDEFETPAEALRFLKSKEGDMTRDIFQALVKKQEDGLMPEESKKPFDVLLKEAREMAKKPKKATEPAPQPETPTVTPELKASASKVSTQEEYDALPQGSLFLNTTNNKYMWKL